MKKAIMIIAAMMIQTAAMADGRTHGCDMPEKKEASRETRFEEHTRFVVRMLALDEATAAKFSPVYKDYLKEKRALRCAGMAQKKDKKRTITEAEAAKIIKKRLQLSRKLLDVREKYYNKFGKIITSIQVKKIYDMEQGFDMKMRKVHHKRKAAQPRHAGGARK